MITSMDVTKWILWSAAFLLSVLVLLFLWVRPKSIDPRLPGPKRHPLLGITFFDMSELTNGIPFDWAHWPTISVVLSRLYKFHTWGGTRMKSHRMCVLCKCLQSHGVVLPFLVLSLSRPDTEYWIWWSIFQHCVASVLGIHSS